MPKCTTRVFRCRPGRRRAPVLEKARRSMCKLRGGGGRRRVGSRRDCCVVCRDTQHTLLRRPEPPQPRDGSRLGRHPHRHAETQKHNTHTETHNTHTCAGLSSRAMASDLAGTQRQPFRKGVISGRVSGGCSAIEQAAGGRRGSWGCEGCGAAGLNQSCCLGSFRFRAWGSGIQTGFGMWI